MQLKGQQMNGTSPNLSNHRKYRNLFGTHWLHIKQHFSVSVPCSVSCSCYSNSAILGLWVILKKCILLCAIISYDWVLMKSTHCGAVYLCTHKYDMMDSGCKNPFVHLFIKFNQKKGDLSLRKSCDWPNTPNKTSLSLLIKT